MPYVRTHGNQISIVHGERDKSNGKVQQRTLFTLYSKKEAEAAIGEATQKDCNYFRGLLEGANPKLKFDWNELSKDIKERMDLLPDIYPLAKTRSEDGLVAAIDELVRQLTAADPFDSPAFVNSLNNHADDFAALQKLINQQLESALFYKERQKEKQQKDEDSPFYYEDKFCWRHEIKSEQVPIDIEEFACGFYERHEYAIAKSIFSLLVRSFPDYAEGHNYLGLIALDQGEAKEAVKHFKETIRTGRKMFPSRISKRDYWLDLDTRPYMRGMMNLPLALVQAGEYREALVVCDELIKDCGEKGKEAGLAHKAEALLNLHSWRECADAALEISYSADMGFLHGFALFELGRIEESIEWFLHASLNEPHTAYLLVDKKKPKPLTNREIEDHNGGVLLLHSLARFLKTQSTKSRKFFSQLIQNEEVKCLMSEAISCTRKHFERTENSTRENLQRWNELQGHKFAKAKAKKIFRALAAAGCA